MRDLREDWDLFTLRLSAAPQVCLLSDFDGTLVPLSDHPDQIQLPGVIRRLIDSFRRSPRAAVGIVSGRALDDLIARVSVEGIWYVGNHGFEVRTPAGDVTRFYEDGDVEYLNGVRDELAAETASVPGVLLEHKGPIVAIHYRRVAPDRIAEAERAFCRVMERHRSRLRIAYGNRVFEARLRAARNKGSAVRRIRREMPSGSLVVYFGDDLSDRDAFRDLRNTGVSVEVGGSDSGLAHYTLPDPSAVWEILQRTLDALDAGSPRA